MTPNYIYLKVVALVPY